MKGNWGQVDLSVSLSEKMAPINRFVFQIFIRRLGSEQVYFTKNYLCNCDHMKAQTPISNEVW